MSDKPLKVSSSKRKVFHSDGDGCDSCAGWYFDSPDGQWGPYSTRDEADAELQRDIILRDDSDG